MFTALFSAIPAIAGLLGGGKKTSSGDGALAACQSAYSQSVNTVSAITMQRNAALVAIPVSFVLGFLAGRRK